MAGRPPLLYAVCYTIPCLMLLAAWQSVNRGLSTEVTVLRTAAARGTAEKALQLPAGTAQGVPLLNMPEFKHYWVGNSSIPGAGLGVFARTDMPAGTIWNFEDAQPDKTLVLALPAWQALTGLVQHLRSIGHGHHPIAAVWGYFDVYAYECDGNLIASVTGSTFTNHAPVQPEPSSQEDPAGPAYSYDSRSAVARLQTASASQHKLQQRRTRYANSEPLNSPREQRRGRDVTPWQVCTLLATLRDVRAGEELLEDYLEYDPPCVSRRDCPEFLARHLPVLSGQASSGKQGLEGAVLVQSLDVYIGNSSSSSSSSSRPGGGLGVFAARDLPAGTVWNKEDAAHALTVTRDQWTRLLQLHQGLLASSVSKPLISQTIDALRSHGFCCPLDGRMYVTVAASALVRRLGSQVGSKQPVGMKTDDTHVRANVANVTDALGAVSANSSVAAQCTWLQTARAVKKGEELVVADSQRCKCPWPGM